MNYPNSPAQAKVSKMMKAFTALKPIFFDTETTGIGSADQVIELTIIDFDGSVLFDNLIKPSCAISPEASAVHGIAEDMLVDCLTLGQHWASIQRLFQNRFVMGYNVDFDVRMLHQSAGLQGISNNYLNFMGVIDVMTPYAYFYGEISSRGTPKWQKLGQAAAQMGIEPDGTLHRSRADTDLTRKLALRLAELAAE